jgi:hypothetical protein
MNIAITSRAGDRSRFRHCEPEAKRRRGAVATQSPRRRGRVHRTGQTE